MAAGDQHGAVAAGPRIAAAGAVGEDPDLRTRWRSLRAHLQKRGFRRGSEHGLGMRAPSSCSERTARPPCFERRDAVDRRQGARQRRDARHLVAHRCATDVGVIDRRVAPDRSVDDQLDPAIDHGVDDMRSPLVNLVDPAHGESAASQEPCRAVGGDDLETERR